jgi:hypothetical protein
MNTLKKALYIGFGVTLFTLGLVAAFIYIIVGNVELSDKILAISISLSVAIFGWWLLRRGSNSVREAITWIIVNLIP